MINRIIIIAPSNLDSTLSFLENKNKEEAAINTSEEREPDMGSEAVKSWLDARGFGDRITVHSEKTNR